jgi:hypothetical protein
MSNRDAGSRSETRRRSRTRRRTAQCARKTSKRRNGQCSSRRTILSNTKRTPRHIDLRVTLPNIIIDHLREYKNQYET